MRLSFLVAGFLSIAGVAQASTVTDIDLNDFFAGTGVSIAADGSSASFVEDSSLTSVFLSNDPFLGDPNVVLPAAGRTLSFDYSFVEDASSNDDEFFAFVLDTSTGFSAGSAFEFASTDTSSGTVSFDLSSLVGTELGLQFQMSALPGDQAFTSTLSISNLQLIDAMVPVPLPTSLPLLAFGAAGLGLMARRKRIK